MSAVIVGVSAATARRIANPGPRCGPVAVTPSHPTRRLGYVTLGVEAMREAMRHGDGVRHYLPVGARALQVDECASDGTFKVTFTTPSLRELADGELIPRWTIREANNGRSWWWEEVRDG